LKIGGPRREYQAFFFGLAAEGEKKGGRGWRESRKDVKRGGEGCLGRGKWNMEVGCQNKARPT